MKSLIRTDGFTINIEINQYVMGFALNKGTYRALSEEQNRPSNSNILQLPPKNSFEFIFKSMELPVFFLPLSTKFHVLSQSRAFRTIGYAKPEEQFIITNTINSLTFDSKMNFTTTPLSPLYNWYIYQLMIDF